MLEKKDDTMVFYSKLILTGSIFIVAYSIYGIFSYQIIGPYVALLIVSMILLLLTTAILTTLEMRKRIDAKKKEENR